MLLFHVSIELNMDAWIKWKSDTSRLESRETYFWFIVDVYASYEFSGIRILMDYVSAFAFDGLLLS